MRYFVTTLALVLASACTAEDQTSAEVGTLSSTQSDAGLLMNVMDVFKTHDSIIITGKIESGTMANSGTLCLHSTDNGQIEVSVLALSVGQKLVDSASEGTIVGVQVTGLTKDDISKGDTITESCKII